MMKMGLIPRTSWKGLARSGKFTACSPCSNEVHILTDHSGPSNTLWQETTTTTTTTATVMVRLSPKFPGTVTDYGLVLCFLELTEMAQFSCVLGDYLLEWFPTFSFINFLSEKGGVVSCEANAI